MTTPDEDKKISRSRLPAESGYLVNSPRIYPLQKAILLAIVSLADACRWYFCVNQRLVTLLTRLISIVFVLQAVFLYGAPGFTCLNVTNNEN